MLELMKWSDQDKYSPDDKNVVVLDYTKANAIDTCIRWGLLRYHHHKTNASPDARAMALELGEACHQVFAAFRVLNLMDRKLYEHADVAALKMFGAYRYGQALEEYRVHDGTNQRAADLNFGFSILHSSGFYDDPSDRRRTLSNAEESLLIYYDRMLGSPPIYVEDESDPNCLLGVENSIDLLLLSDAVDFPVRFVGRIDGIEVHDRQGVRPAENKTTSRLSDAWEYGMHMSHQVTGYNAALAVMMGREDPFEWACVYGMQIPAPRTFDYGAVQVVPTRRTKKQFYDWVTFIETQLQHIAQYGESPHTIMAAPTSTHACNRFFRPCPFIDLCMADEEDQIAYIEEMRKDEWSPLKEQGEGE